MTIENAGRRLALSVVGGGSMKMVAEALIPLPEGAVPRPEGAVPLPEWAVPLPEEAVPLPEGAVPPPEWAAPLPEEAVPLPEEPIPPPRGSCSSARGTCSSTRGRCFSARGTCSSARGSRSSARGSCSSPRRKPFLGQRKLLLGQRETFLCQTELFLCPRELPLSRLGNAAKPRLPIPRRHLDIPSHYRLTGQPLVWVEPSLRSHASLDHRPRAEAFRSGQHADAASPAYPYATAGVADRRAGAACGIEHGFVGVGLGARIQGDERYLHCTILPSSVHKEFAPGRETFHGHRRLYKQTTEDFHEQRDQNDG
jgi:hypothetical protein